MWPYLRVYKEFLRTSFAEATSYRLHFVLLIVMDNIFYLTSLLGVSFIFDHIHNIGPWDRAEFMFFIAFMLAVDHLHMTFVSENFWEFSYGIRIGVLDFILLKPLNAIFTIFFRLIRPATMFNFFIPLGTLIYFGLQLHLSVYSWLLVPFMLLLALTLQTSLEILMSMSMFWLVQADAVNFMRMQFQSLSRWPDFIYRYYARKFFTLAFPLLLIGSVPVKILLNLTEWKLASCSLLAIAVTWLLIAITWRRGLRSYESASS